MKSKYSVFLCVLIVLTACQKNLMVRSVSQCEANDHSNPMHPMKDSVRMIIQRYIANGIPGIQVAVKNKDGLLIEMGGYASIENKTSYGPCSTGWLFSITKTYTAALVMKLKEQGLIDLEKPISTYLKEKEAQSITDHEKITVKMLLNHSSGIVDFANLPAYQMEQFNNPLKQPALDEILKMLQGHALNFIPGSDFSYSNSNYLLLHYIIEHASGKSYAFLLNKEIIQPLHLDETYYTLNEHQLKTLGFPNYYFDRYANENLENITAWNNALGNACASWGGIAATAPDAIRFYEALMNGQVVSTNSLQEMKTWVTASESSQPDYGLGLEYFQYAKGTTPQIGHEGDGIGNSTMILYVPDNNTYLFINCNAGRRFYGPYLFKITDFKNELSRYVANWRP